MYMNMDISEFERVIYGADPKLFENKGIDDFLLTGEVGKERPSYQCASDAAADFMVKKSIELVPDMEALVLEPSAGKGKLLKRLLVYYKKVCFFEINKMFVRDLSNKGGCIFVGHDFRNFIARLNSYDRYDLIVMNPPHGFGAYSEHILTAKGFLKPNGVLIFLYPKNAHLLEITQCEFNRFLADCELHDIDGGCGSHECRVGIYINK